VAAFVVIIVMMLTLVTGCKNEEADRAADVRAVKEVLTQYGEATNAGDFDRWISLWATDGTRMAPNSPPQFGRAQIEEAIKPAFDAFDLDMTIQIEEARVDGDLGMTRCTYTFKLTPKGGGDEMVVDPDGKALTLYERQADGSWKIVYDCFNTNVVPSEG
jgi:uncharacterized protein (TIGR02246 family)